MRIHLAKSTRVAVVALLVLTGSLALAGEERGQLRVLVVEAGTNKPIAGAKVAAIRPKGENPGTTGKDGRATLEFIPYGEVRVRVRAEGRTGQVRAGVKIDATTRELRFELAKGVPFDGVVQAQDGTPIRFATIDAGDVVDTFTDANGRFHVTGIPCNATTTLTIRARKFKKARVAVKATADAVEPTPLKIRLEPGGRIAGVVFGLQGERVPGATVYVVPAGDEALRRDPRVDPSKAHERGVESQQTDDKGRFAIDGFALERPLMACAYARGFARSRWIGPIKVTASMWRAKIPLTLRRAATVVVRVLDAEGRDVSGAKATLTGQAAAESGGKGRHRFVDMWPGEHVLLVEAKGYAKHEQTVKVAEGASVEVRVTLKPRAP